MTKWALYLKKNVTPDPVKLMQIINTGFPSNIFYLVKIQIKVHEKIFGRTHEKKSPYEFCQWSYISVLTEFSAQSKSSPSDVFSRKHCLVSNEHSKLVSSEISFKKLNIVNCQINCKFRVILKGGLLCLRKILSNDFVFLVCISIYISRKPFISIWMNMGFKSIY